MAKLLVIDDDVFFVKLMVHALAQRGHDVAFAYDGQAGEAAFDAGKFDAVVCDLVMPEQEGLETIRYMLSRNPSLAVVAVSGGLGPDATIDILKIAKQFGAHVSLKKPFQPMQLVEAVDTALGLANQPRTSVANA